MVIKIIIRHSWLRLAYAFLGCLLYSVPLLAEGYDGSLIEAVRITLERQSSIAISKQQVLAGEASVLSAQSVFDPTLNAGASIQHTNTPVSNLYPIASLVPPYSPISEITSDVTNYQIGLTQKLRSGITVNPAVTVTHTLDNYSNLLTSPSTANVALNFTLPLQKGRGEDVTTANERAALFNRDAALQNQKQAISTAITTTVVAYWNYLAAMQTLEIVKSAEKQAQTQLDDARKLAAGDEIPLGDVKKYEFLLLNDTVTRIGAEQSLVQARNNLGLAMGLNRSEIVKIPPPRDSFQQIDVAPIDAATVSSLSSGFASVVQNRRADLMSLDSRLRAVEALLLAANDAKKSQLDLVLSVGYNGMAERLLGTATPPALDALGNNVRGGNAFVGLNYAFPVNNYAAQGLVMQQSATLEQIQLQKQALLDGIQSSIEVGLNNLRSSAEQFRHAKTEVEIQREVCESEKKKYRFGMTTLLDLFTNETQLTNAQLSEMNAQNNLAKAIIQLRFATGTLLNPDEVGQTIDTSRLVTLPKLDTNKELSH